MDDDHKSGDPKDLLSRPERDRLIAEERLRATVREDLEKSRNPPQGRFARLVSSENIRWIATTLAIPLTVFAWGEYSRHAQAAEHAQAAQEADKERKTREAVDTAHHNIDLVIRLLPDLNENAGSQRKLNALTVMKALEEQGQLTPTLRASLETNIAVLSAGISAAGLASSPGDRKEVEILSRSAPNSQALEAGEASPSSIVVPGTKLYIQIFSGAQRASAERLQTLARSLGIAVPGIENVADTALKRQKPPPQGYGGNVVIAFKKADLENANLLAAEAAKQMKLTLTVRDHSDRAKFASVPAGQIEVWFEDPSRR